MNRHLVVVALLVALAQAVVACESDGSSPGPGGTGTTSCPIPAPYTKTVSASSDVSSVTVRAGNAARDERASNAPWCNTSELTLTKLNVSSTVSANGCPGNNGDTTVPCLPDGMLVALEIRPTPVAFPSGSQPELIYDLDANPPQEGCELCSLIVYQLYDPRVAGLNHWRFVDIADRDVVGGVDIARAILPHFSVFALVEVPAPAAVPPGGGEGVLIVESDFIAELETSITVQLAFVEGQFDTPRELDVGISRLFRFESVEPVAGLDDPGCPGTLEERLTCLFPVGTEVNFQVSGDGLVSIGRVTDGYRVDFTATLEIL